jgi:peroxiredoxin Q/BCP
MLPPAAGRPHQESADPQARPWPLAREVLVLKVGEHAPAFTATAHTGAKVRLSDFKGKFVVLWFYPEADTGGWTVEGQGFRDGIQQFEAKNAVVLGVSFDSVHDNKAWARKNDFPFLLLSDTERRIAVDYHAASDPDQARADRITYVIGPDGKILQAYPKVDVKSHPAEVLKGLGSAA